jgi:hypothetical protein
MYLKDLVSSFLPCCDLYKDKKKNRYFVESKHLEGDFVGDYNFRKMNFIELYNPTNGNCIQDCLEKMNRPNGYGAGPYTQTQAAAICERNPSILVQEDEDNYYFNFYNCTDPSNFASAMLLFRGHATVVQYQGAFELLKPLHEFGAIKDFLQTFDPHIVYAGQDSVSPVVYMKICQRYPNFNLIFTGFLPKEIVEDEATGRLKADYEKEVWLSPINKGIKPPVSKREPTLQERAKVLNLEAKGKKCYMSEYGLTFPFDCETREQKLERIKKKDEEYRRIRGANQNKCRMLIIHPSRLEACKLSEKIAQQKLWQKEFLEKKKAEKHLKSLTAPSSSHTSFSLIKLLGIRKKKELFNYFKFNKEQGIRISDYTYNLEFGVVEMATKQVEKNFMRYQMLATILNQPLNIRLVNLKKHSLKRLSEILEVFHLDSKLKLNGLPVQYLTKFRQMNMSLETIFEGTDCEDPDIEIDLNLFHFTIFEDEEKGIYNTCNIVLNQNLSSFKIVSPKVMLQYIDLALAYHEDKVLFPQLGYKVTPEFYEKIPDIWAEDWLFYQDDRCYDTISQIKYNDFVEDYFNFERVRKHLPTKLEMELTYKEIGSLSAIV